jgi:hypothetical protein
MEPSRTLLQALAVAVELTGTQLSEVAARIMAQDLARYPEAQVLEALDRCRRELKGRLTIADVVSRLGDGRPGPEEAWSMLPMTEDATVVWTDEMREAFGVAYPLIKAGDLIPARMAFLEKYRQEVQYARDRKRPVEWGVSLGHDKDGRELVILDSVQKGRLTVEHAKTLLPYHREDEGLNARLLALQAQVADMLQLPQPKQPVWTP